MRLIDRIRAYIDFHSMSFNAFDEKIGAGNGYIGKQIKKSASIGSDVLEKIVSKFPDLNPLWLITGEGEMIVADNPNASAPNGGYIRQNQQLSQSTKGTSESLNASATASPTHKKGAFLPKIITVDNGGNENILYVPIKARAGYLTGYGDPEYISSLQSFRLPGLRHGTYRMFEAQGSSMSPTINDKDAVIGSFVQSFDEVKDGRVYIVVTKTEGIVVKRLLNRISERGKLVLKSDTISHRKEHPTYQIDPEDIIEIWYARVKFSADFSEPSEIYHRINDLEADMVEIKRLLAPPNAPPFHGAPSIKVTR